jgi:maltooligosyltrehalose trehalohydrolase
MAAVNGPDFTRPGTVSVWAPFAERVDVLIWNERSPLIRDTTGWWGLECSVPADTDYLFSLNGGVSRPDPRSAWQPQGVHGPSRSIDHRAFAWSDQEFQARPLSAAVIYELHVGTFSAEGTFESVIPKLDHLKHLGVTHVELMPVVDFPGRFGWGYDGVSLFAPRHQYGGPDGLKRLVNACHAHGLGVLLDVVYNHLGPSGNYLAEFGPYFTDRHTTPWGPALNFDGPQSDEVRRFFCDNALMWLRDYHFDGLRLDAVHAIVDTSAIPFIEQLATEVDALKAHLGRHLVLIAESDLNDPRVVRPWEIGGFGLDAQWCDDFHHAVHSVVTGEQTGYYADFGDLEDIATATKQPYVYAGRHSQFRQRQHGRPPLGLSASRFVTFSQNHDQLGNRARGERLCHLAGMQRAELAAALVLTGPYVPLLFQGEEWGATAPFQYFADWSEEPQLAAAVREGRQREFGESSWTSNEVPDPILADTFVISKLDWNELSLEPHAAMLAWYRALLRVRREVSGFTDGRLDLIATACNETDQWLVVARGPICIVYNFAVRPQVVPVSNWNTPRLLLASNSECAIAPTGMQMSGEAVAITLTDEGQSP